MLDGPSAQKPDGKLPEAEGHVDWFLAELVRRANEGGLSMGLTLCVGGGLVSGALVGGREYFEGFAEDVASGIADPAVARKAREFFRSPAALYQPEEGRPGGAKVSSLADPLAYIHLKAARFFNAAGEPISGNHGGYWRGKLSAVDGFVLGLQTA
jgi:hypothetical protein